ncbi:hypothetical protein ATSB10_33990 [Dyella thiooxydans]|uniref:Uncharacterized protein n=1 Tax=Dyella thiooxydans TaxID=445710 RepID=A0A160N4A2_9GAMM|nr:hypothetical protein ATSB10_33990 [Dyella thiooxydans]
MIHEDGHGKGGFHVLLFKGRGHGHAAERVPAPWRVPLHHFPGLRRLWRGASAP